MIAVPGRTAAMVEAARREGQASRVRQERDTRIAAVAWRVDRYRRETELGLSHTDDLTELNTYIQALCDVPKQPGFPESVLWPDPY